MNRPFRLLLIGTSVIAAFVLGTAARAETVKLELKRLEAWTSQTEPAPDSMVRMVAGQRADMQGGRVERALGAPDFSTVAKKEPTKYDCEKPFRFVAKFGSRFYPFVADGPKLETQGYDRVCFDRNHNGDLTDDDVVKALPMPSNVRYGPGSVQREFPRIDVPIEVDGQKLEYSFFLRIYSHIRGSDSYVNASLTAAVYREGQAMLDGKPHKVVVLDYNTNGRFDDRFEVAKTSRLADGQVVLEKQGDIFLVDPDFKERDWFWSDPTARRERQYESELLNIEGKFYDVKVSPAGDAMTILPCKVPMGAVKNASEKYQAILYGKHGVVKIIGSKEQAVPLPAGDWRLCYYTIDLTEQPGHQPNTRAPSPRGDWPKFTLVHARGRYDTQASEVLEGKIAVMPFGPPYKPTVRVVPSRGGGECRLEMSLVGAGGELCSAMYVNGDRPEPPTFTIKTPRGKEVDSGTFKFG